MGELTGRTALITGGVRRIGRAIALELAACGADIVVHSRSDPASGEEVVREARKLGVQAKAILADITRPEEAKRLVEEAVQLTGNLDILVNSAAIRRAVPFEQLDYEEWRAIMAVILDGTYLCCHAAAPYLAKRGNGRIVTMGGLTAFTGAHGRAHVCAAKAGVVGLTKALALDLGPSGITVNCISPGLIEDPADPQADRDFRRKHSPPEKIPLQRSGTPDDVAKTIAALCGDRMSYVTGQNLHINGGVFLW
ncbi:MAG TPA: SDR family NAD(P)-dependent oxidoreductase [Herbaspirillum sp.]|jgi:3-oxoacyl-[acyl-carrier protein] reductase